MYVCMQVEPADVIIVEGIMVLALEEVRSQLNMKIYVVSAVLLLLHSASRNWVLVLVVQTSEVVQEQAGIW